MSPAAEAKEMSILVTERELRVINLMQEEYKPHTFSAHHQHIPVDVNGEAGHLRVYRVKDCGFYLK